MTDPEILEFARAYNLSEEAARELEELAARWRDPERQSTWVETEVHPWPSEVFDSADIPPSPTPPPPRDTPGPGEIDPFDPEVETVLLSQPRPADRERGGARQTAIDEQRAGAGAKIYRDEWSGRYEDLGRLGEGGMAEVRLVRDLRLNRTVAMKLLKPRLTRRPDMLARFLEEAQANAQLQHPGIVPVHALGRLSDGRYFFVMREVRGQTLSEAITRAHAPQSSGDGDGRSSPGPLSLIAPFARICEAVAYAHKRGVIHRDLKPGNIMLGENGDVLVLDWGIAKVSGRAHPTATSEMEPVETERSRSGLAPTQVGTVAGTPTYMAPEQAMGYAEIVGRRSDVYALGAILYEILSGQPPYEDAIPTDILAAVAAGPPPPLVELSLPSRPPQELLFICDRAMARDPALRYPDARAMAADVHAWLDGSKRRRRALMLVSEASERRERASRARQRAETLHRTARALLDAVPSWAPEGEKAEGWLLQDEATALEREALLEEIEAEHRLRSALTHAPGLREAHKALASYYREQHEAAEALQDQAGCARAELHLRNHVDQLSSSSAIRRDCTAYLQGSGALSIHTVPAGAEVSFYRYELKNRRLVAESVGSLGYSPLDTAYLPMGSYLMVLRHAGHSDVRYPVHITRQHHWDGVPPGAVEPTPIRLPELGALTDEECYVPAGWFVVGGDPQAQGAFPRQRVWLDGFVIQRFPVTNRGYLAFLNDLVARGREEEALSWVPRERAATSEVGTAIYGRDSEGRFELRPDADGDEWHPDWPVFQIDWFSAEAYARWYAEKTGQPWRLVGELEWEKAGRGVDGRFYPWGNHFDASWACTFGSHPGRVLPAVVDSFPADESPYGVRGMAGNVMDWCADVFRAARALSPMGEVFCPADAPPQADRVYRGGTWGFRASYSRLARRYHYPPTARFSNVGVRLARSLDGKS